MRTMINLLPASYRRHQILRKRVMQWTAIVMGVLVFGWLWHWREMREGQQLVQQLEVLSREHAPTRTMLKQLMHMRQQLKDLQHQETVAKELETQRTALTLLGVISDTAQKTKGRLRVTNVQLTNFQNPSAIEGAEKTATPPGGLTVTGVSLDNAAVAELLDGLQHAEIFSKVELLELKEREDKSVALSDYKVVCEF